MRLYEQPPDALKVALARYTDLVDGAMRRMLDTYTAPPDFYGMMRYHLGWVDERLEPLAGARGKGLRAALLLLVNIALGGDEVTAAPLAAAIELLHNFSLVHDDIEDGSTTRRHRATLWSIWGAPVGINAGDGLFAIAHLALHQSPLCRAEPARFITILHHFEQAVLHLCEGQHRDMIFERTANVSVDDYLRMIAGKSAALIATAAWIGARAAPHAPEEAADAAGRFGRELGLAFQMQDDILGVWGDEAMTGKSATSDIASRKKTLPVLLAMAQSPPESRERLHALYAQPGDGGAGTEEILALLDRAGAHDLSRVYLRRHYDAAMDALEEIGVAAHDGDLLRQFARLFVDRST